MYVFLTGATGFVGAHLIPRLLKKRPEAHLDVLIRSRTDQTARDRLDGLLASISQREAMPLAELRERVHPIDGDLAAPRFGLSQSAFDDLARRTQRTVHSAASVELELPLPESRRINVGGSRNVLALASRAQRLGGLEHHSHLSTAYVAGRRTGRIHAHELDRGQAHNNPYERSKLEAEQAVRQAMDRLPITVFRPSMIMGDSRDGYTTSFNVLYGPMKLGYFGKLPVIPHSRSNIDAVPIDHVADAVVHLSHLHETVGQTHHLTVGSGREITAIDLFQTGLVIMERIVDEHGLKNPRRVPKVVPPRVFKVLTNTLAALAWGRTRKIFRRFKTYVDYSVYDKTFDNTPTARLLAPAGLTAPRLQDYLEPIVRYAIETHFGRADGPRDVL